MKTISIVGTGYVGLSSAAVFANAGYKVFAIDIDPNKIKSIRNGKSHFYELGLDAFIQKALDQNTLIPTLDYAEAIPTSEIIFSSVGTPDKPDGSHDLSYIYKAAESVAQNAQKPFIYVQKSTVPVGTGKKLIQHINDKFPETKFSYVSNPEFLREGSALFDTLNMDRIVVGSDNNEALEEVIQVYRNVDNLARDLDFSTFDKYADVSLPKIKLFNEDDFEDRVIKTNLESAELIKVSSNAFLSLKISFANSIAKLCDQTDADIVEVMDGVGGDHRIGRSFLYAGRGYGGGCFPKDVSGLIAVADEKGVESNIMKASVETNESMPAYIVEKMKDQISNIEKRKIAFLGLSFKPGTSDIRKSPSIKLVNTLAKINSLISAYDPEANGEASSLLSKNINLRKNLEETIENADLIVVATDWPVFKSLEWKEMKLKGIEVVVDCMNGLNRTDIEKEGIQYIGVGR